jgi:hypothetical protein
LKLAADTPVDAKTASWAIPLPTFWFSWAEFLPEMQIYSAPAHPASRGAKNWKSNAALQGARQGREFLGIFWPFINFLHIRMNVIGVSVLECARSTGGMA